METNQLLPQIEKTAQELQVLLTEAENKGFKVLLKYRRPNVTTGTHFELSISEEKTVLSLGKEVNNARENKVERAFCKFRNGNEMEMIGWVSRNKIPHSRPKNYQGSELDKQVNGDIEKNLKEEIKFDKKREEKFSKRLDIVVDFFEDNPHLLRDLINSQNPQYIQQISDEIEEGLQNKRQTSEKRNQKTLCSCQHNHDLETNDKKLMKFVFPIDYKSHKSFFSRPQDYLEAWKENGKNNQ